MRLSDMIHEARYVLELAPALAALVTVVRVMLRLSVRV